MSCDAFTVSCDIFTVSCDTLTVSCDTLTVSCDAFTVSCDIFTVSCDIFTVSCDTFTVSCDTLTVSCDAFTVSCDIFTVSCDTLTVSCDTLTVSCDTLTVSCDAFTVSCDIFTVSCDTLTVSCDTLTVSCDAFTVSCDIFTVSCDTLTVSCDTLTVSCDAFTVSCDIFTVSCDTLTVSCDTLTVSCDAFTVSCDIFTVSCDTLTVSCDAFTVSCDIYFADEEEFVSEGSEFYLAFFNNLQIGFFSQAKVMVRVSNVDVIPDTVEISYDSESRKIESGSTVEVELPTSLRLKDIGKSGKGVSIRSVNGAKLSVTAFGDELTSSDTYQLLPCVYLPSLYEYYAVSVAKVNIVVFDDGEELISEPLGNSVLVVIASEDNTHVTLTPTQDVFVEPDKETEAGESVDITLSRGETLFISSEDDLTGSHVVSDKPLAVFSGHECGNIPSNISYCDQMVEQIPPTATWGREFYATSFLTRRMDRFKAISSKETNTIRWSCTGGVSSSGSLDFSGAGVPVEFDIDSDQSCRFKSDYPILLVQFSVGSQADNILDADPSMTVIPPAKQYRNSYMLNYFIGLRLNSYLNIILLNTSDDISTSDTLFNGVNFEGNWTVIRCDDDSSDVCAYSIQLLAPESGTVAVSHSNPAAKLMGIPYALGLTTGRGSFSGMSQEPIACK